MASDDDYRRWQDAEDDRRRRSAEDDRRRQSAEDERRRQNAEDERRRQEAEDDRRREDERRRQNAEDDRRAQDDADDRRWSAEREAEQKSRFDDAMRKGDHDTARWILGVPPAGSASASPREPVRPAAASAAGYFRNQTLQLLCELRSAEGFLPSERLADWAMRVEGLDIYAPERALAEIEAIRSEYLSVTFTGMSQRADLASPVASIGHKMKYIATLLRYVLASK